MTDINNRINDLVSNFVTEITRLARAAAVDTLSRALSDGGGAVRTSAGTGTGHNWLRTTLLESAWAASHARKSYLGAQYRRISKRRGPKRAAIAVAHTILVIAIAVHRH